MDSTYPPSTHHPSGGTSSIHKTPTIGKPPLFFFITITFSNRGVIKVDIICFQFNLSSLSACGFLKNRSLSKKFTQKKNTITPYNPKV